MSFWINDEAGVAWEFNEAGECRWNPSSSSFNLPMKPGENSANRFGARRATEDEAEAFARSHVA